MIGQGGKDQRICNKRRAQPQAGPGTSKYSCSRSVRSTRIRSVFRLCSQLSSSCQASSEGDPPAQPPAERDCRHYCSLLLWQLPILDLIHQGFVPMTTSTHSHCCITEVLLAVKVSPSAADQCFWWIRKVFPFFTDVKIQAQLNCAKHIWNCIWFWEGELTVGCSLQIFLLHHFIVFVRSWPVF